MNKKKSIVILSVVSVFIILMAVFAVVSFPIAGTVYDYNGFAKTIKLGLDMSGGVSAVFGVENDGLEDLDGRINGTINSLQSLLVSKGYTESTVTKGTNSNGEQTIRVEVPDVEDPERVLNLIGRPAAIYFKGENSDTADPIIIGRDHISSAFVTFDDSQQYAVGLRFNSEGTKAFAQMTQDYLNQQIYIYNGTTYISTVTVNSQITNGQAIITRSGGYTYQEAYDFATQIQSGSLGVTLKVLEERNISPTLGQDAVRIALIAGAIGVGLIFLFLGIVYRGLGLAADLALCVYIVLLLWFCAVLPWVQLTLPGIAGILLSIGMAVDANVIIFERIKQLYRSNKSRTIQTSIKDGFKNSTAAIIDGNITTLIGAVVLWILGSSAIVGFAVTLFIGIILSMFTSLVVTRLILKCFVPLNSSHPGFYGLKYAEEAEEAPAVPVDQKSAVEVK